MEKLLGLILVVIFIGCSNIDTEKGTLGVNVVDESHTDCLKSISVNDSDESFFIKWIDKGCYRIEHLNVMFNCCLPEGIEMSLYAQNDTLFYSDNEKVMGICDCICAYNTNLEFDGIESGEYVLCLSTADNNLGCKKITFNDKLDMEITISDLDQN